jgi:hypothetical protein
MSYSLPGLNICTVFPERSPGERHAKRNQLSVMDGIRSGLKPSASARGEGNLSRMYGSRGIAQSAGGRLAITPPVEMGTGRTHRRGRDAR